MPVASFASHLVRKIVKNVKLDLARAPRNGGLPPALSPVSPFGSGLQRPRNSVGGCRDLFKKPASCRCLGLGTSSPPALPVASRQLRISTAELSTLRTGKRVTAPRVLDFAVWDVLIVTFPSWKAARKKMKNLSERVKVIAFPCSRTIHRVVRSDRPGPLLADYHCWLEEGAR